MPKAPPGFAYTDPFDGLRLLYPVDSFEVDGIVYTRWGARGGGRSMFEIIDDAECDYTHSVSDPPSEAELDDYVHHRRLPII
jgi:hypothetical protein